VRVNRMGRPDSEIY